jgi:hypothetical protein
MVAVLPDRQGSEGENPETPTLISFNAEITGLSNALFADKLYFLARKFTKENLDMQALAFELEALGIPEH